MVKRCEFAIDGCVSGLLVAAGFSIAPHREFGDLVETHRPEVRLQVPRQLAFLAHDVLAGAIVEPLDIVVGCFSKQTMGFASRREVQTAFTRVRSGFLDECLGLRPRDAFALLADDAVDALAIAKHVDRVPHIAILQALGGNTVFGDPFANCHRANGGSCQAVEAKRHQTPRGISACGPSGGALARLGASFSISSCAKAAPISAMSADCFM